MKSSDNKILQTSGKITLAFLAFILMLIGWIGNVFPYGTQSGTRYDLHRDSRSTDYILYQPFENTYTMYFGTQSVTGSGSTGYIPGSSTAYPRLQYNSSGLTFNFVGATLQNEGVDVTVSSDLTGYIAVSGGTGTGNVLTNTTLDGAGTITASIALSGNITANSLEITPAELSSVNNASSELQAQITTATGSITNHAHSGSDGTTQIAHDSVTGTGTNSHSTLDTFVSSKAQASGLASLDTNSFVVQNPASGTTTPTASKMLIADGAGKIADGWLNSTVSLLGQTIALGTETTGNTDNVTEGSSNLYYLDSRVDAAVGSLSVSAHSDIIFTSPAEGHKLVFDASLNVVNATDTAIVAWSGITGNPTANGSITVNSAADTIPFRDASQNLFASGIVGGTTTGALRIPVGTTAQRPGTATVGMIRYNTTTFRMEVYGDGQTITGGSITTSGSYTVHTFTTSGTFDIDNSFKWRAIDIAGATNSTISAEILLVAGGGGGDNYGSGGGGAGGMRTYSNTLNGTYTVIIGAGGAIGADGNTTSVGTMTVSGGGGGNSAAAGSVGGSGSGGGASAGGTAGGAGTGGEGNAGGGSVAASPYSTGGGGGKGAVGASGSGSQSGAGGIGEQSSISGSSIYYAGGGGGGGTTQGGVAGAGGNGGGGKGGAGAVAGTANTGGGGGGGTTAAGDTAGAAGGSGIVIIRYPTP